MMGVFGGSRLGLLDSCRLWLMTFLKSMVALGLCVGLLSLELWVKVFLLFVTPMFLDFFFLNKSVPFSKKEIN